jgi:uncharacterized protein YjbI with pentapeptide repeats
MKRGKTWTARLGLMALSLLVGALLILLTLLPAFGQEAETIKSWTSKLTDGRKIANDDLTKILQAHSLWLTSGGNRGQRANLSEILFIKTILSGALLNGANLSKAGIYWANLSKAELQNADLSGAVLFETNLSEAQLYGAHLNRNYKGQPERGATFMGQPERGSPF